MGEIDLLLKAIKEKKLLDGAREVKKAILNKNVEAIFIASNCPENLSKELKSLAEINTIKVYELEINADQLAAQLKRPYNSIVLAILKTKT